MHVYINDDYAGLEIGEYEFYFGYGETQCKKHESRDECEEADCEESEWCFTARRHGGNLLMKVPDSELETDDDYRMEVKLLAGIGKFINEYIDEK